MKLPFFSCLIIWAFINYVAAQDHQAWVAEIHQIRDDIQARLAACDTLTKSDETGGTTAAGYTRAYYLEGEIQLIEQLGFYEKSQSRLEFYFLRDTLCFAYERHESYNRPVYWDQTKAQEAGDTVVFDPGQTVLLEDRYYFRNRKIFLWIDADGQEGNLTDGTNSLIGKGLIAHCYKTKRELEE
ncbi:MAG: hypothetical protein AAFR61_07765 [Bacteroidota bacterium]